MTDDSEGEGEATKRCRCGHDRKHHMVSGEGQYTGWGWFWVLFGVSAVPKRIRYHCRVCGEQFDETTEPELLRRHI